MKALLLFLTACGSASIGDGTPQTVTSAVQREFPEGEFFGAGSFNCVAFNNDIERPHSSTWLISKRADGTYDFIGDFPTVNSQPIIIHVVGNKLLDEQGEQKGDLQCSGNACSMKFKFDTNGPFGKIRMTEILDTDWVFAADGSISETARLHYHLLPLVSNCDVTSHYVLVP